MATQLGRVDHWPPGVFPCLALWGHQGQYRYLLQVDATNSMNSLDIVPNSASALMTFQSPTSQEVDAPSESCAVLDALAR